MQRLNRSPVAPLGTVALFLFLGLASLPVSLRVAGVQVSFSPRLSAAVDAWDAIAGVFGATSQPGADLSVVRDADVPNVPSSTIEVCTKPVVELGCPRGIEDSAAKLNEIRDSRALKAPRARRAFSVSGLRGTVAANQAVPMVEAGRADRARTIGVLGATKLETAMREGLLKRNETQFKPNTEALAELRNLPIPTSRGLRFLVRTKRVAAQSSLKAAECKVFSALDSARRQEWCRARLIGIPSTIPDTSEF